MHTHLGLILDFFIKIFDYFLVITYLLLIVVNDFVRLLYYFLNHVAGIHLYYTLLILKVITESAHNSPQFLLKIFIFLQLLRKINFQLFFQFFLFLHKSLVDFLQQIFSLLSKSVNCFFVEVVDVLFEL